MNRSQNALSRQSRKSRQQGTGPSSDEMRGRSARQRAGRHGHSQTIYMLPESSQLPCHRWRTRPGCCNALQQHWQRCCVFQCWRRRNGSSPRCVPLSSHPQRGVGCLCLTGALATPLLCQLTDKEHAGAAAAAPRRAGLHPRVQRALRRRQLPGGGWRPLVYRGPLVSLRRGVKQFSCLTAAATTATASLAAPAGVPF